MVVFSLMGWSPLLPSRFLVSRRTLDSARVSQISFTGISPSPFYLSRYVQLSVPLLFRGPNPKFIINLVWALPISLATTLGITFVIFSSGYLDVSVPRVPLMQLWIHCIITRLYSRWVPSFGYLRLVGYLLLPVAFRSLSRPSSAPCTKASSVSPL